MISFVSECNRCMYCMSAARTSDTIALTISVVLVWLTTVCFGFYFVRIVIGRLVLVIWIIIILI